MAFLEDTFNQTNNIVPRNPVADLQIILDQLLLQNPPLGDWEVDALSNALRILQSEVYYSTLKKVITSL